MKNVTIRLSEKHIEMVREVAEYWDDTKSGIIRRMIENGYKEFQRECYENATGKDGDDW